MLQNDGLNDASGEGVDDPSGEGMRGKEVPVPVGVVGGQLRNSVVDCR